MDTSQWAREGFVRIVALLEVDDDGYPPSSSEGIWAKWLERSKTAVIDNIPFYPDHLALADVVTVRRSGHDYVVEDLVSSGGHSSVKILIEDGAPNGVLDEVRTPLRALGCFVEWDEQHRVILADVPPEVDLRCVAEVLEVHVQTESIDYWVSPCRHTFDEHDTPAL